MALPPTERVTLQEGLGPFELRPAESDVRHIQPLDETWSYGSLSANGAAGQHPATPILLYTATPLSPNSV